MGISDSDFNEIMGAAHPAEDSSPPAISDQDFAAIMGKPSQASVGAPTSPVEQRSPQGSGNASLGQTWGKGALTGALGTITNNVSDYIESEFPGALSETQYPKSFLDASPQQRREYFQQQRAAVVDAFYKGVDTSNHPIANFGAQMVGGMADPLMAIAPELKGGSTVETLKNLSKFGAVFGAASGASHGLSATGQIDPKEVAVEAAVGAVLTPAVGGSLMAAKAGLSMLASHLFDHATATGRPVTPDQISDALAELQDHTKTNNVEATAKDFDLPPIDNVKMAQTLNEAGGLTDITPEQSFTKAVVENELGIAPERPDIINNNLKSGKADQLINGELDLAKMKPLDILPTEPKPSVEDMGLLDIATKEEMPLIKNPWEANVQDFKLAEPPVEDTAADILQRSPDLLNQVLATIPDKEIAMTRAGGAVRSAVAHIADGDIPIESDIGKKIYPRSDEPIDPPGSGGAGDGTGGGGKGGEPPEGGAPDPMSTDETQFKRALQIGWASGDYLAPMKNVWRKLGTIGDMMSKDFTDWKDNYRMQHGTEMVNFRRTLMDNKVTKPQEAQIQQVLSKLVDEKTVPANVQRAAQQIRNQFNEMVAKYYKQGILTKDKAAAIIANAKQNGYFPHVYDKSYLRSTAGQEAFMKALSDVKYKNETSARSAIRSIMGEKKMNRASDYIEMQPDGTYKLTPSTYEMLWNKSINVGTAGVSSHMEMARVFPPEVEPALQPFLIKDLDKVMSNYLHDTLIRLEGAKIWGNNNESFGELFKWAWAQNPETAKSFRDAFFKEIGDPRSSIIRSFVEAPKAAAVGSSVLRNLQLLKLTFSQITNLPQLPVNGALVMAKAEGVNPIQKLSAYVEGILKGWGGQASDLNLLGWKPLSKVEYLADLKEQAQAFGAATEHIYAEFAGRISDSSKLGQFLEKIPVGGELIKNPGKYLDYTLFNASEDINRIGAYHMGKAYILQLLKNRAKFEAMGSKANPNKLEAVYRGLEEVGISREIPTNKVSIDQVESGTRLIQQYSEEMSKAIGLGAQRISNIVNFVNDAHEMPRLAQTFWGKMLWQLRRFSYGQWQLVKDYALKPALKGNFVPLATYLGVGTLGAGMAVNAFRKMILADDKQLTTTAKLLAAQQTGASFGIVQDALNSATYGQAGMLKFGVGPGFSELAAIGAGAGNVYNQAVTKGEYNLKPLGKAVLREMSFPYKSQIMKMSDEKSIFDAKFKNINEGKSPFD